MGSSAFVVDAAALDQPLLIWKRAGDLLDHRPCLVRRMGGKGAGLKPEVGNPPEWGQLSA